MKNRNYWFVTLGLSAAAATYWLLRRRGLSTAGSSTVNAEDPSFHPSASASKWNKVDEASWESFPASDPPAIP